MDRTSRLRLTGIALMFVVATATIACSTGSAPGWTFAPAPSAAVAAPSAAASAAAPSAASSEVPAPSRSSSTAPPPPPASSRSRRSTSASRRARSPSRPPGRYDVTFKNTGAITHDLTFADGTKIAVDAGETATVDGRRPGRAASPSSARSRVTRRPGMKGAVDGQRPARASRRRQPRRCPAPAPTVAGRTRTPPKYTLYDATAPRSSTGRPTTSTWSSRRSHDRRRPASSSRRSGRSTAPSRARSSGSTSATRSASTSRTRPPTSCPTASTSTPARSPGTTR